ncbi:hypothetical protein [Halobacillus sp. A5]|uniref:hypothetical protein n=1 Tax=Halobacillus sp. A5 TaxID=2880263 RepID=UPI0020A6BF2E|nr:hypothetical protein [Halobacillus sp. A5]MCP3027115.1 hypothetical protein [Halobacillus sp. A5]
MNAKEDYYVKGKPRDEKLIKNTFKEEVQAWREKSVFFKIILYSWVAYIGALLLITGVYFINVSLLQ